MNMFGVNGRNRRLKNMALVVVPLSLVFFSKGWLSIANRRTQQTSTHTHTHTHSWENLPWCINPALQFHPSHSLRSIQYISTINTRGPRLLSSGASLPCPLFASFTIQAQFDAALKNTAWSAAKSSPSSWKREGLSAPGSALFTTCHFKSIALYYQRNNIHKKEKKNTLPMVLCIVHFVWSLIIFIRVFGLYSCEMFH